REPRRAVGERIAAGLPRPRLVLSPHGRRKLGQLLPRDSNFPTDTTTRQRPVLKAPPHGCRREIQPVGNLFDRQQGLLSSRCRPLEEREQLVDAIREFQQPAQMLHDGTKIEIRLGHGAPPESRRCFRSRETACTDQSSGQRRAESHADDPTARARWRARSRPRNSHHRPPWPRSLAAPPERALSSSSFCPQRAFACASCDQSVPCPPYAPGQPPRFGRAGRTIACRFGRDESAFWQTSRNRRSSSRAAWLPSWYPRSAPALAAMPAEAES